MSLRHSGQVESETETTSIFVLERDNFDTLTILLCSTMSKYESVSSTVSESVFEGSC